MVKDMFLLYFEGLVYDFCKNLPVPLLLVSRITSKMRLILLLKKKKEASEIKIAQIVHEYIKKLYLMIIYASEDEMFNLLIKIFENIYKNGTKSHKKDKQTVFDILKVPYNGSKQNSKKVA
jgi:hypothetical protein